MELIAVLAVLAYLAVHPPSDRVSLGSVCWLAVVVLCAWLVWRLWIG
jgi:hypothetical protein